MMNRKINNWKSALIILVIGLTGWTEAFASGPVSGKGIFELLSYQEVVPVTLSFDIEALTGDRRNDEDHNAKLSFTDKRGDIQEWDIELSLRGNFRRIKCSEMPPLKIKFKKKDLEAAGLAPFNDMKLVTYCVEDEKAARETLLKEYLIYKLYNQITIASYRVQLLDIEYKDVNTGETRKQMGFLIEDTAQLRDRLGADKSENERIINPEEFHTKYRKTVAVFEYRIGNADWILTSAKNVKYIVKDTVVIPVPYDFDFSALVDAPYALFVGTKGQSSFYDRVYLGFEREYDDLERTINAFSRKKEALYQTIRTFKHLKPASRQEMIDYLDTFFENSDYIKFPTEISVTQVAD